MILPIFDVDEKDYDNHENERELEIKSEGREEYGEMRRGSSTSNIYGIISYCRAFSRRLNALTH